VGVVAPLLLKDHLLKTKTRKVRCNADGCGRCNLRKGHHGPHAYWIYKWKRVRVRTLKHAEPPKDFWARAILYEPFTFGPVWQHVKYKLQGEEVKILSFICYVGKVGKSWQVHEKVTGGFCGKGRTRTEAIAKTKHNFNITPDFAEQCKKLGSVECLREENTDEVLRRLTKTSQTKVAKKIV